jgi:hypothetical protein
MPFRRKSRRSSRRRRGRRSSRRMRGGEYSHKFALNKSFEIINDLEDYRGNDTDALEKISQMIKILKANLSEESKNNATIQANLKKIDDMFIASTK